MKLTTFFGGIPSNKIERNAFYAAGNTILPLMLRGKAVCLKDWQSENAPQAAVGEKKLPAIARLKFEPGIQSTCRATTGESWLIEIAVFFLRKPP